MKSHLISAPTGRPGLSWRWRGLVSSLVPSFSASYLVLLQQALLLLIAVLQQPAAAFNTTTTTAATKLINNTATATDPNTNTFLLSHFVSMITHKMAGILSGSPTATLRSVGLLNPGTHDIAKDGDTHLAVSAYVPGPRAELFFTSYKGSPDAWRPTHTTRLADSEPVPETWKWEERRAMSMEDAVATARTRYGVQGPWEEAELKLADYDAQGRAVLVWVLKRGRVSVFRRRLVFKMVAATGERVRVLDREEDDDGEGQGGGVVNRIGSENGTVQTS